MGDVVLRSALRELRLKAGLQQRELAARVGVSRQTLTLIEAGTTSPSTTIALQLARALGCRVEDVFSLSQPSRPLEAEWLDEAAPSGQRRVALASVRERWVAHELDGDGAGALCEASDGIVTRTRAGRGAATVRVQPFQTAARLRDSVFAAGCDPALGLVAAHLGQRPAGGRLHWIETGSGAALDLLANGKVHIAGIHLYDQATGEHNVAEVKRWLRGHAVLVTLATWQLGLTVAAGNPHKLRGVSDLCRKGVRVLGREKGTGSDELLARLAAEESVAMRAIDVVAVVRGHRAVAQGVATGLADAGIATRAAAGCFGLGFVPLAEARFDLVIPTDEHTDERIQRVLDVLGDRAFKRDLGGLAGYGTARTGKVVTEVTA